MIIKTGLDVCQRTFDDVYGSGLSPTSYTAPEYTDKRVDTSATNAYVHDCVFRSCTGSSNGGAICCGSGVRRLLVEQSSFISCKTSGSYGGAIYFSNTGNGECVLSRICGFNCYSTNTGASWGQFAYLNPYNNYNYKNHVNDSTITRSSNQNLDVRYTLDLRNGNILCPSVNLSHSVCVYVPALYCDPSSDTCCISYSSIVNNTASNYMCIYLYDTASSHCIDTCNIINNKQTSSSIGIIYAVANLLIKDSCILGNYIENTVFYEGSSSCKITISNCTFDNNKSYGSVIFTKMIENAFINALSHIATQSCDSYFDSYGTLSVKPNVLSRGSRCLFSCNCNFNYYFIFFSFYKLSLILKILH
jgi:hypothetical protein